MIRNTFGKIMNRKAVLVGGQKEMWNMLLKSGQKVILVI